MRTSGGLGSVRIEASFCERAGEARVEPLVMRDDQRKKKRKADECCREILIRGPISISRQGYHLEHRLSQSFNRQKHDALMGTSATSKAAFNCGAISAASFSLPSFTRHS